MSGGDFRRPAATRQGLTDNRPPHGQEQPLKSAQVIPLRLSPSPMMMVLKTSAGSAQKASTVLFSRRRMRVLRGGSVCIYDRCGMTLCLKHFPENESPANSGFDVRVLQIEGGINLSED